MIRTQIRLTEEQARRLREAARQDGVSMSDVVRLALEAWFLQRRRPSRWELMERAKAACGVIKDAGPTDLATNHNRYLAEVYGEDIEDIIEPAK